jgi:uncharacterized protein YkuJ
MVALFDTGFATKTVYAFNVEGGPLIEVGDFSGDLDAFRLKIRSDKDWDNDELKRTQYLGFANIVAGTWCPEKVENV